jgi:hypothetical protein
MDHRIRLALGMGPGPKLIVLMHWLINESPLQNLPLSPSKIDMPF